MTTQMSGPSHHERVASCSGVTSAPGRRPDSVTAAASTSAARVDGVDIRWRGYTGEFPEFAIVE